MERKKKQKEKAASEAPGNDNSLAAWTDVILNMPHVKPCVIEFEFCPNDGHHTPKAYFKCSTHDIYLKHGRDEHGVYAYCTDSLKVLVYDMYYDRDTFIQTPNNENLTNNK